MFNVGDRVEVNGYTGRITEVCTGDLEGMAVVRLDRGAVCVDESEIEKDEDR